MEMFSHLPIVTPKADFSNAVQIWPPCKAVYCQLIVKIKLRDLILIVAILLQNWVFLSWLLVSRGTVHVFIALADEVQVSCKHIYWGRLLDETCFAQTIVHLSYHHAAITICDDRAIGLCTASGLIARNHLVLIFF